MNKIQELLFDLGLSTKESLFEFYPKVRDRDDISVLKCKKSGVMLLSCLNHIHSNYYDTKQGLEYWNVKTRKAALNVVDEDSERRKRKFKEIISNQNWLEVGAGNGASLEKLSSYANKVVAVEPQPAARQYLLEAGFEVFPYVNEVPYNDFNVVTLFHVFEHLIDPLLTLEEIKQRMSPGAKIIIEVPHANDFLISFIGLEEFKAFTFWSEHLILHTRESLQALLHLAGFHGIVIKGVQRYPLANHLYWLSKKMPGGHNHWPELRTEPLDTAYEDMLASIDKTDTLVATAYK